MRVVTGRSLIAACCLLGVVASASAKDRALVVGVNVYPGITVGGVAGQRDLGGAVFDAKTFAALLDTEFHVSASDIHTLLDAQATHDAILHEFETWLIGDSAPGDRVFFYFAGHGSAVRVTDEATGGSRMTSAIVPSDAKGELSKQPLAIDGLILGVEMKKLLDRLSDRRVLVIADSCQSGSVSRDINHPFVISPALKARTLTPSGAVGMTEEAFAADTAMRREVKRDTRLLALEPDTAPAAASPTAPTQAAADPLMAVWSAAAVDQVTFDLGDRPGGVFTQSLAEGLRDKKAVTVNGQPVTANALINYIRDQAKIFCTAAGASCSAGLTPQLVAPPVYLTEAVVDPGQAAEAPAVQNKTVGQAAADKLSEILSHKNDFGLHVEVLPGASLQVGTKVHFRVTSEETGKVAVFDLTPDGDLTQIFPNTKTAKTGIIHAHAPLTMPDPYWGIDFTVTPPAGPGSLLVLVTEEGVDLSKATHANLDLQPLKGNSRLLEVLAADVEAPVVSPKLDEPTRQARWAFIRVPYTVLP